jgi:tRNA modification GTPase
VLDEGMALYFPGRTRSPAKMCWNCRATAARLFWICCCKRCLELGCRLARPGEFSERAFLNDKLDLAQAEAIADLIEASSAQAARNALRSLQGRFPSVCITSPNN